ncbi:MAG: hypothetical protein B6242_05570 [Anaerolineaceae bacterium 4572_78]|nr:MAG: hypothetical protein B6242_05570 [Anaerolineaceae bacterium 4572_78]
MTHQSQSEITNPKSSLSLTTIWAIVRSPEMYAMSLILLTVALILSAIIPQQPLNSTLPTDFNIFTTLGLFQIYHTAWLWLPIAWLVFVSMIVLADITPLLLSYMRSKENQLKPSFRHPIIRYLNKSLRIPAPKDSGQSANENEALEHLHAILNNYDYHVYSNEHDSKQIYIRYPRHWLAPIFVIVGILVILLGCIIQSLLGVSKQQIITTDESQLRQVANHDVRIINFMPKFDRFGNVLSGDITVNVDNEQDITWKLHHPSLFANHWIIPTEMIPYAEVELVQDEKSPEVIALEFSSTTAPVFFLDRQKHITFELRYIANSNAPLYRLNIMGYPEELSYPPPIVHQGQIFFIPSIGLKGEVIFGKNKFLVKIYRLPGIIFILIGVIVLFIGMVMLVLSPPSIVRLDVINKGRGSWIMIETETLGTMPSFVTQLDNALVLPTMTESHD